MTSMLLIGTGISQYTNNNDNNNDNDNDFIGTHAYKDYALMHNYTVLIRKSDN